MADVLELAEIMELRKRVTSVERTVEAMRMLLGAMEETLRGVIQTSTQMNDSILALVAQLQAREGAKS